MIANFDPGTHNIWLFLEEGDLGVLEENAVEGKLLDISSPGKYPGEARLEYDGREIGRPDISRGEAKENSLTDFNVEIAKDQYEGLTDGNIYHDRVGAFQDLVGEAKIWIFPPDNHRSYEYMWDELQFKRDLTNEQRDSYAERLE